MRSRYSSHVADNMYYLAIHFMSDAQMMSKYELPENPPESAKETMAEVEKAFHLLDDAGYDVIFDPDNHSYAIILGDR